MRGHDRRDDGRGEQAAEARDGTRHAHAAGAQVGGIDLGGEGVERPPGAQQREAHEQGGADHHERRRTQAVKHAAHRAEQQEADQRGLAAPALHAVGREREPRQLHQRQHHQEDLAAHEGEALAAELHRQVDEDAVVGDGDQRPGQEQRQAAAAQFRREQREQRLALLLLGLQRRDRRGVAVDLGHALEHLARLVGLAVAVQVHGRLGDVEPQHHAHQRRNAGHEEDHAPGIVAPGHGHQGQDGQEDGAHGPERFQQHQPAPAAVAGQELGHHGVVHGQRAAHADAGDEAQHQQPGELGREGRGHAGAGIDHHRHHQHRAAPDAVGQAAEDEGADQHADEEEGAGLQCLGHRLAEGLGDGRCAEADGQHLHGVGQPDQAEDHEEPVLEPADTRCLDAFFHRNE